MTDTSDLALAALERLLARHGGTEAELAAALDEAGLLDVLSLDDERPHATAAAILRTLGGHHGPPPPLERMMARWLAGATGLVLAPDAAFAWPLGGDEAALRLAGSGPAARLTGVLEAAPGSGAPLATVLDGADGCSVLVALDGLPAGGGRPWRNLAGEARVDVALDAVPVRAAPLPQGMDARRVLLAAAHLGAARLLGAMERCLSLATRYAGERQQFGRPIGRFQAVQHMVARLSSEVALVRVAVHRAGEALDGGAGALEAATAKALASAAASEAAALAHQVHGAIGFTEEYPLGGVTRRLWAWRDELGDERYWHGVLGRAARRWGGALWPNLVDGEPAASDDVARAMGETPA